MFKHQPWQNLLLSGCLPVSIIVPVAFLFTKNIMLSVLIGSTSALVILLTLFIINPSRQLFPGKRTKPAVVFLTGLSGAGKTTIAKSVISRLRKNGTEPVLLDGDEIRNILHLTGFDEASRKKHNLNIGFMAGTLEAKGNLVIVSLIAPYEDTRLQIRQLCNRYIEVYVSTPLETCIQRDSKGLYKKALRGEIAEFTGISAPYQPPSHPDIMLDTSVLTVEECSHRIIVALNKLS